MRGATLLLVASAACSSSPTVPDGGPAPPAGTSDASQPPPISVTPFADVFVARGRTVSVTITTVAGMTVDIIDLPPGVSAQAAYAGTGGASIAVTATPDAPIADLNALAIASDSTGIRGSAPIRVAVTGTEGALDPSFGVDGVTKPPLQAYAAALAFTPDGHLAAALSSAQIGCKLAHLAPDGSLDATFALVDVAPFPGLYCADMAMNASGNVAMLVASSSQIALVPIDASGTLSSAVHVYGDRRVVWTGSGWFTLGATDSSSAVSTSGVATDVALPVGTHHAAASGGDGSVLIVGTYGNMAHAYKLAAGGYALDTSFGNSGAADLGPSANDATAAIADGQGGFFVGVDASIVHVDPNGKRLCTLALPMESVAAFVALPSGDVVALGPRGYSTGLMRLRSDCSVVSSFGAFGLSETTQLSGKSFPIAAYDGTAYLYVAAAPGLGRFTVSP